MQIPEPIVNGLLESWPVARLASLGSDGSPHQVPIVFARVGGQLWSPIDGKPKRDAVPQRIHNLHRDGRVSVLVDHYEADWSRLWWIRVDGVASARSTASGDAEVASALARLRAKYPQYGETPISTDLQQMIRIEVGRISSWCAGPDLPEAPR